MLFISKLSSCKIYVGSVESLCFKCHGDGSDTETPTHFRTLQLDVSFNINDSLKSKHSHIYNRQNSVLPIISPKRSS
jgi:hypothetical protein